MTGNLARVLASVLITVPAGIALIELGAKTRSYGYAMFLAVPFVLGFGAVTAYGYRRTVRLGRCLWISMAPLAIVGVALLLISAEGLICLAMAFPVAAPLCMLGGWIAWRLQRRRESPAIAACLVLLVPASIVFGPHGPSHRLYSVSTSIVIDAPPEIVWRYVPATSAVTPSSELLFRAGVAHPLRTEIESYGPGAVRHCELSTGDMVERVEVWDPPRELRFAVISTPPPMRELSPYRDVTPPHLHGFYVVKEGQFRLTPLPGGRTQVDGTSWYEHGLEPAGYWRLWCDYIGHGIHRQVFESIKRNVERDARVETSPQIAGR